MRAEYLYRPGHALLEVNARALGGGGDAPQLVGAREPVAGVGRFRQVARTASAETGGGRVDSRAPNVYDVITGSASR